MRLAKPHLDIGLFTTNIAAHTAFWGETIGLRLDHKLDFGTGVVQHRYDAHGSVIKVNHSPSALPATGRSGITGLTIARTAAPNLDTEHPDGDRVRLVPPGTAGVTGIGITISTPDPARALEFYLHAMEFEPIDDNGDNATVRCGDTLLF
ncbi:MAG: VOC family protein, partial [Gammaproteobacteria bacterium]